MTFGEKLKELRAAAGLTQAQLAKTSGTPIGTLRDYEQGRRDPLFSSARRLALALGVSLDVLPDPGGNASIDHLPRGRPQKAAPLTPPAEDLEQVERSPKKPKPKGRPAKGKAPRQ